MHLDLFFCGGGGGGGGGAGDGAGWDGGGAGGGWGVSPVFLTVDFFFFFCHWSLHRKLI